MTAESKGIVLVIDDDESLLSTVTLMLERKGYATIACSKPAEATSIIENAWVDLVLSDIVMPEVSGITILDHIHNRYPELPVILMTAYPEIEICIEAIQRGAFDFIVKPFKSAYLIHTVEKALKYARLRQLELHYKEQLEGTVREKTKELLDALKMVKSMSRELVNRLTIVSEYKSADTGVHISRVGLYANKIAECMDMPDDFIEAITLASSMHDIGKIGIPDIILEKPDKLTPDEFSVMKQHTTFGHKILSGSKHYIIEMAAEIALGHHEKWDGSGYPAGLRSEGIPIQSRIVLLCDQYDALRSRRPYKNAFDHESAYRVICNGDGRTLPGHFDPEVLKAFREVAPVLDEIFDTHSETGSISLNTILPYGIKPPRELNRYA